MTLLPAVGVYVAGFYDQLNWSERITLVVAALAAGILAVNQGFALYQRASGFMASRREQSRIKSMLDDYEASGWRDIDTPTAAAFWSGTRADSDPVRHLRFRMIKGAIDGGEIAYTQLNGPSANMNTWMAVTDFRAYLIRRGVLPSK